jgi:hypothetical protein
VPALTGVEYTEEQLALVSEILSTAAGGIVPPLPSFCHVKIKRNVVPARDEGKLIVAEV